MRYDYACFGDSITFDTTYMRNMHYRLSLYLFMSFNNHHQGVIFGDALLYDEAVPSFFWLFIEFLCCINGKPPKMIFTDQDPVR
ncbi:Protein FAR1-RELATED SEQUENCE 9 [Linum perenne]